MAPLTRRAKKLRLEQGSPVPVTNNNDVEHIQQKICETKDMSVQQVAANDMNNNQFMQEENSSDGSIDLDEVSMEEETNGTNKDEELDEISKIPIENKTGVILIEDKVSHDMKYDEVVMHSEEKMLGELSTLTMIEPTEIELEEVTMDKEISSTNKEDEEFEDLAKIPIENNTGVALVEEKVSQDMKDDEVLMHSEEKRIEELSTLTMMERTEIELEEVTMDEEITSTNKEDEEFEDLAKIHVALVEDKVSQDMKDDEVLIHSEENMLEEFPTLTMMEPTEIDETDVSLEMEEVSMENVFSICTEENELEDLLKTTATTENATGVSNDNGTIKDEFGQDTKEITNDNPTKVKLIEEPNENQIGESDSLDTEVDGVVIPREEKDLANVKIINKADVVATSLDSDNKSEVSLDMDDMSSDDYVIISEWEVMDLNNEDVTTVSRTAEVEKDQHVLCQEDSISHTPVAVLESFKDVVKKPIKSDAAAVKDKAAATRTKPRVSKRPKIAARHKRAATTVTCRAPVAKTTGILGRVKAGRPRVVVEERRGWLGHWEPLNKPSRQQSTGNCNKEVVEYSLAVVDHDECKSCFESGSEHLNTERVLNEANDCVEMLQMRLPLGLSVTPAISCESKQREKLDDEGKGVEKFWVTMDESYININEVEVTTETNNDSCSVVLDADNSVSPSNARTDNIDKEGRILKISKLFKNKQIAVKMGKYIIQTGEAEKGVRDSDKSHAIPGIAIPMSHRNTGQW